MKLLFVNSCMRGEASRTLELCRDYIEKFTAEGAARGESWDVEEVDLTRDLPAIQDNAFILKREELLRAGKLEDSMFDWARQLMAANHIVFGAPYWDLSFPAALKIYLERCCVTGLTFIYSPEGIPQGQLQAKSFAYITTSGAPIGPFNFGYDYVKGLFAALMTVDRSQFVAAEALDIYGNDPAAIMADAKGKITEAVQAYWEA